MNNTNINREYAIEKILVDHATKTITMPIFISKAASMYGTEAFKVLVELKNTFPSYDIKVRESKGSSSRNSRDTLKGLTVDYIEKFLAKYGSEEQKSDYELLKNPVHDDGLESKKFPTLRSANGFSKSFRRCLTIKRESMRFSLKALHTPSHKTK